MMEIMEMRPPLPYCPLSFSRQINDKCRCGCGRIIIDDNFS